MDPGGDYLAVEAGTDLKKITFIRECIIEAGGGSFYNESMKGVMDHE